MQFEHPRLHFAFCILHYRHRHQLISILKRRTGLCSTPQTSRILTSTFPLIAGLLRRTSSTL
jgi:hypothetical protein